MNLTTGSVVTMEFVSGIKINDVARIDAAGIDRKLLAKRSELEPFAELQDWFLP